MCNWLIHPISFWICNPLVRQNAISICSPFQRIRGIHLLLGNQNIPMALTHPPKPWIPSIQMLHLPSTQAVNLQLVLFKKNHLTGWVKYVAVTIQYVHEKCGLLTIDPVKLKTTTQTEYIGTNISTGSLLACHYS